MSDDVLADLDRMIGRLRTLPELARDVVPDVAEIVREEIERTIAQGTTPEGETWQRTREGKRPMPTAGKALRVVVLGPRVFVRISDHVGRHSLGRARGGIVRRVLPRSGSVPRAMAARIRKRLGERFREHMGEP